LGSTLCSNGSVLVFQRSSSTIEFCKLPNFQSTRIPWRHGLIRDLIWCSAMRMFIMLTKDSLYSIDPLPLFSSAATPYKRLRTLATKIYNNVKPFAEDQSFWRCTCIGTRLLISYSGM
jgi:hypothetical protein